MEKCGCVAITTNNSIRIRYCPLHQAAPALLAACEMAIEAATVYDTDEFTPGQIEIRQAAKEAGVKPMEYVMKAVRAAIAEAKGSEPYLANYDYSGDMRAEDVQGL